MKNEFILAYPKQELLEALISNPAIQHTDIDGCESFGYRGKETNGFRAFAEVFDGLTGLSYFSRREELEKSTTEIHPIPYILFERADESIYTYQRGKETEEGRLAGDDSVGVGGHPEIKDAAPPLQFVPYLHAFAAALDEWLTYGTDLQTLVAAILREAHEEVRLVPVVNSGFVDLDTDYDFRFHGFLYDKTNDVGIRHLAMVFTVKIPNDMDVKSKEMVIEDRGFFQPEEIIERNKQGLIRLENWSKVMVEHLAYLKTLKPAVV